ncbi:SDR family oxidoreductase [Steroidobacter sp. S1-65]|uniref:SDR family oxidoreductase n=1 Tax=Steroidobacter gossypii TaxID=2805490 RepID=A0ABS1X6R2_9GAMM|nr:SDR family oxidoreductase [Steroidobacter gossypii]
MVTGAGGGIGHAICASLSKAGAQVIATDIGNPPQGLQADAWFSQDVTSAGDWQRVISEILIRFGGIDCLINNAGISLVERIADTSIEQCRRVLSVNVESVLLGLQASLPILKDRGAQRVGGASVVNVSSTAGLRGVPFNAVYSASKGAVTLLSKSAAKEFAVLGYPIRVNSIHPGGVDTPMMDAILARYVACGLAPSMEVQRDAWKALSALRRMARPDEIGGAAVFLCSPAASYITGSELVIDGGATA